MSTWAVGDIQGCFEPLQHLLSEIDYRAERDRLILLGDLVNRGPQSLEVLRWARAQGDLLVSLLGNHDLHLLALALGEGVPVTDDDLALVLAAADGQELVNWLRHQPLVHHNPDLNTLMVHAGIIPSWSVPDTLARAREVEAIDRAIEGTSGPLALRASPFADAPEGGSGSGR